MDHLLFTEEFRPHSVGETILPSEIKNTFQKFVDDKFVPNILLSGGPGVGKTSVAKAVLEEIGVDYIFKNSSMEGNIDTLRTDIQQFASSVSLLGGRKYVILDEFDRASAHMQDGLKAFMEEYASNTGWIFCTNNRHKIIEPLQSRCSIIEFRIPKEERATIAKQFFDRLIFILDSKKIEYNKATLAALIQKYFPDWRRVLNEVQRYSVSGKIDSGILTDNSESLKELILLLKSKSFTGMRKYLSENSDMDYTRFYRQMYDTGYEYFAPDFVPQLVIMIGDSMNEMKDSLDPEIALAKFSTELMLVAKWKD